MRFALWELYHTLEAAWEAADLRRRLAAWWYVITHRDLVDGPAPHTSKRVTFNDRQLAALELARKRGRVTNGDLQERFAYHPETLRLDLAALVRMGYLEKNGQARGTFYTRSN
jgi:predicted HTH transcriptional regulator